MANQPAPTNTDFETGVPRPFETLTLIQRTYIDWKALGGLITDDEGIHELTLTELGAMLNPDRPVHKSTLSKSCLNVPNFWLLVEERRKMFSGSSRLEYMHKRWYVKAATIKNWPVTEAWLINHDPTYQSPKLKVEHDIGTGFADLIANKRKQITATKVIEGETTDDKQANA